MAHNQSAEWSLTVDGEEFVVRLRPRHGPRYEYDYEWVSGPHHGYGFGLSGPFEDGIDEHRERIRSFLAEIDPATGYLPDG